MGKRSSSSADTTVSTTTTTNIRDIGLTGTDAVDLAAVLAAGQVEAGRQLSDNLIQLTDFGAALIERNAANAVQLANVAAGRESDTVKIVPFLVAAAIAALPLVMRK